MAKSIKVMSARLARGYSGWDHLLDDAPLEALAGRRFASPAAAAREAGRLLRGTQDRRCAGLPVIIVEEDGSATRSWTDGTPA